MRALNRTSRQGFTFVEVMCVMIIISIVSSIALPAINNFHSSERCKAEASILVSYIRQAKYQAMQENSLNRIIFLKDGIYGTAFKVQKYNNVDDEGNDLNYLQNVDQKIEANQDNYNEENNWNTIADIDEIEFNSSVEVDLSQLGSLDAIYFKPDGFIYTKDTSTFQSSNKNSAIKIPEYSIYFKYGSSAVAVNINALGVISSEAIPNEEDDEYFDDKHKEDSDTDTDTNYTQ
jgi:prepilin-type N-terminal cleavage/methylation domain-containing protein